jgi:REP element-mobilizing transposase RayT
MANTYSRIYYHAIFSVKNKDYGIHSTWKDELYKYITGIIKSNNQKVMIINGMPDHVHLLIGAVPDFNLSVLVKEVKCNSSKWINKNNFTKAKFRWQTGFSAFSLGYSQLPMVTEYIKNQEIHHKKRTFREEYLKFLDLNEIQYDIRYVF